MRRFAAPFTLILFALGLALFEYRAARSVHEVEFERTYAAHEYESAVTTELIARHDAAKTKRVRVSAPLENAWMNISASVLRPDGTLVDTCRLSLDFFLKPQRGIHWTWGLPMASAVVAVPEGDFRIKVDVLSKGGAAVTTPPLVLEILPAVAGSYARLLACAVSAVLGVSLLLRALAQSTSSTRVARTSHKPHAAGTHATRDLLPAGRLHFIDGLRGIAAVSVLACHLFVPELLPSPRVIEEAIGPQLSNVMRTGKLGVEIFFVLSGFVIAYSIRRHRVTPQFFLRFIARRSLRLDPPYYVALFLALVVAAFSVADSLHAVLPFFQGFKGMLINAFYLQDIFLFRSPIGSVAWTLCLEVQFYLALVLLTGLSQWAGGLFARAKARARATRATWWGLFGSLGILSLVMWHQSGLHSFTFFSTWFRFLLGVLVFRALSTRARPWPIAALLAGLMLLSIVSTDARGGAAVATAGLILFAGHAGALGRWLNGPVWQFFGKLSYSLYLYHIVLAFPFLSFVWNQVPHTLTNAVLMIPFAVVVAILCAWLMYVLIERPSIAVSQRVRYEPPRGAEPVSEAAHSDMPLARPAPREC